MRWVGLFLAGLALAGASFAQTPPAKPEPAFMAPYRAYLAAFDANNIPAAEAAAADALRLAEAAKGDSNETASFAVNLAVMRLLLGKAETARAPLARVQALAAKGF